MPGAKNGKGQQPRRPALGKDDVEEKAPSRASPTKHTKSTTKKKSTSRSNSNSSSSSSGSSSSSSSSSSNSSSSSRSDNAKGVEGEIDAGGSGGKDVGTSGGESEGGEGDVESGTLVTLDVAVVDEASEADRILLAKLKDVFPATMAQEDINRVLETVKRGVIEEQQTMKPQRGKKSNAMSWTSLPEMKVHTRTHNYLKAFVHNVYLTHGATTPIDTTRSGTLASTGQRYDDGAERPVAHARTEGVRQKGTNPNNPK